MADRIADGFDSATLASEWTAGNWAVHGGALRRVEWESPDLWPDLAYRSDCITRGDCQISGQLRVDGGAELGLMVLTAAGGDNGYEFRINRNVSPSAAEIVKVVEGVRTTLAAATLGSFTAGDIMTLKGRIEGTGYEKRSGPCRLSLYFNSESTALLTCTDQAAPIPRGNGYPAIRARNGAGTIVSVDDLVLRRLYNVEVPDSYEMPVWSWDRLADNALMRLERGGNTQFEKAHMLDFLGFAEQELAQSCGEPWWLDRTYEFTTSAMLNDMEPWIATVTDGIIEDDNRHLKIVHRNRFNLNDPGRLSSSTPSDIIFMGVNDDGTQEWALYPAPSDSVTVKLWVKARAGYIGDSSRLPLTPPSHVEGLIFGALRRAMSYDTNRKAWEENERLWAEAKNNVIRDHKRKTGRDQAATPYTMWGARRSRRSPYMNPRY